MPSSPVENDTWVNVEMAARILGVQARTVRYYVEQGRLAARRIGARGWMSVSLEGVHALKTANPQGTNPENSRQNRKSTPLTTW